jgi:hypothetical protein
MSFLLEPGDLSRTPLAAVLLEAFNQRADGVLAVEHGGGTSRLWFRGGQPVGAQVFTGFRPLGHMLLQAGKIDVDALSRSLAEMAASGRPQGEILVELGAVTREDVDQALAEQQAGYVALIAALDAGAYRFDASQAVPEWTRGSRLSPVRTIVEALERPQAAALVTGALQPAAAGARLATGYLAVAEAFRWSEPERRLVARLERPVSLEAFFVPEDGVSPERARAALAALLLLGLALPAGDAPTGDTSPGATLMGVAAQERGEATPPPGGPAVPLRRSDPAEARERRQRLLARAMKNMGLGPLSGRPAAVAPAPDEAPAARAEPDQRRPDPPAGPAEAALRQALLAAAPRARKSNLFARLGLPDTATGEEVKLAYVGLARQFHPDRFLHGALADLGPVAREHFTAVYEAYEVLKDNAKRARYAASLGAGGGGATEKRAEGARVDYQKGEACLRTRDFARARGFLESAIRADPKAEYRAALAWSFVVDPRARDLKRAKAILSEALEDKTCDRAFYVSGIVARDEGDEAAAERFFRATLSINPDHVEARRELRLAEGRRAQKRR